MKTRILTAVSAAALLGISSFALAQGTSGGGTGGAGAPSGGTMQRQQETPPAGSSAQTSPSMSKDSMSKDDMKSNRAQGKDTQKSQAQGKEMGKDTQKSTQSGQMGKDTQKSQAQDRAPGAAGTKSQMTQEGKEGAKSGTTVGAATSGAVNLSTEQRTTIRNEVLTTSAPRVDSVNFSVSVGTVVPTHVRVIEVPPAIVKIRPAWKGYRYFVYQDDIIIVEPRTLKIVAVLEV
jgi:hypothetical protein